MHRFKDDDRALLRHLVQSVGAEVIHLPYTEAFDKVHSTFCQRTGTGPGKHDLWEQIIVEREPQPSAGARGAAEAPSPVAPMGAPATMTAPGVAQGVPARSAAPSGSVQSSLFQNTLIPEQQPWTLSVQPKLSPDLEEQRKRLLASIADSPLGNTEQRVAYLLQRFPETRDSDLALCIRYWRRFQPEVLERWDPLELEVLFELDKLETIGRVRRELQNTLHLFRGMEDTAHFRSIHQQEMHEYLAAHKGGMPEVRFYLDETGNEGDRAYTGVAGVCAMNWTQYEKHYEALSAWRRRQKWPETIHFADTGTDRLDRAIGLLGELERRRSGVLFVGYALSSRGRTHSDLLSLFVQLVVDSLRHLAERGCLDEPRSLRVVKEADPGFDSLYLAKMTKQLSELVALEFPGLIAVQPIEAVTKGRDVLLECADLVAGGMQRRASYKGRNPKDRLAEAVFNVTGFEDSTDSGALLKFYPARP